MNTGRHGVQKSTVKTDLKDVKVLAGFKYEHGKTWGSEEHR